MKLYLVLALMLIAAGSAFADGPIAVDSSHGQNAYTYEDIVISVVTSPTDASRVWLSATYSYPLMLSERDRLLECVRNVAKKIDIAVAHQTTVSYSQDCGRFYTDDGAVVSVSFQTSGYASSYAVVQIMHSGNNIILMLNRDDTRDFITMLGKKRSLVDDYQKQVALFQ